MVNIYTHAQLEEMKYRELRALAKRISVKANGTRDVLLVRLVDYYKTLATVQNTEASDSASTSSQAAASPARPSPRKQPQANTVAGSSRTLDTWSGWAPKTTSSLSSPRASLIVENTVEWAHNPTTTARQFKHRDPARHAYAQMYRTLDRRARSIPPFYHEGPESAPRTPPKSKGKSREVYSPPAALIPSHDEEKKCELEVHLVDSTIDIESTRRATLTPASRTSSKPKTSSEAQESSPTSPLFSPEPQSQETKTTSQPTEPSQAQTEGSSQDPWLAYGHSQRASPDPYENFEASAPRRARLPESSQPYAENGEEVSLTQLIASSQPKPEGRRVGGVDRSTRSSLDNRAHADEYSRQSIAEATLATFKMRLAEHELSLTEDEESELLGTLARMRNAARARRAEPQERGRPAKRDRDSDSGSEGASGRAVKRQRL